MTRDDWEHVFVVMQMHYSEIRDHARNRLSDTLMGSFMVALENERLRVLSELRARIAVAAATPPRAGAEEQGDGDSTDVR